MGASDCLPELCTSFSKQGSSVRLVCANPLILGFIVPLFAKMPITTPLKPDRVCEVVLRTQRCDST